MINIIKMKFDFNKKILVLVAIFIVVILIAALCYSMKSNELFNSGKELHYYSLSTCPHCVDFNPIWEKIQNKTKNCYKYVVDKDEIADEKATKFNIRSYPTVIIINNDVLVEEVSDLSCKGIRDMCKKHKIPCTVSC